MKISKSIPNTITCLNLLCGLVAVVLAFKGKLELAFYLMIAAAVLDFLDGLAARLLNAYSPLGKELDSLADLVSFGVLPSVMLYSQMKISMFSESFLCYIPLLIAVFSALRLAKFNIDPSQKDSFKGLATPACALLCASMCSVVSHNPASFLSIWASSNIFIPILSVVLCALLVSRIDMFSLKFSKNDEPALRIKRLALAVIAAASVAVCVIFGLHWSLAFLITILSYIVKNLIYALLKI